VQGEISVFMGAIGRAMFSPEHLAIIGLAGPANDSFDEERGGVLWQYEVSARTGVTLQFRQDILVGALITLLSEDGVPAYPTSGSLIDGLALPSSRQAVAGRLGAPRRSSELMDLYLVDDVYLRFDFLESGQSSLLTVVSQDVEV
jgi:hypothetical protein